MKSILFVGGAFLLVTGIIMTPFSFGVPVGDFKKDPLESRVNFITGGIFLLSAHYAIDGQKAKSECLRKWFNSESGQKELWMELGKARFVDPTLHVEHVILAVIKKKCGHLD